MGQDINEFADELLLDYLRLRPDLAGTLGIDRVNGVDLPSDTLPDYSEEGLAARQSLVAERQQKLRSVDRDSLTDEDRITADVLHYILNDGSYPYFAGITGQDFDTAPYAITHITGSHAEVVSLLSRNHPVRKLGEAEAWLARLHSFPHATRQTVERMRRERRAGRCAPRRILKLLYEEVIRFTTDCVNENLLCRSFESQISESDMPASIKSKLLGEATRIVSQIIYPAYRFLCEEIDRQVQLALPNFGLCDRPDGEANYAWLLKSATTVDMSPDEVHELGHVEIQNVQDELRSEFNVLGLTGGTMRELFAQLNAVSAAVPDTASVERAALLVRASDCVRDMESRCKPLFGHWPDARVDVRAIPAELESSMHSYYTPQRIGDRSPAQFLFNIRNAQNQSPWELPTLCHHEAYPGHHLQLSIAQELDGLPMLRRNLLFSGYLEGWAKYAETIPIDHGFTSDPLLRVGRLRSELYSTANLVLDTGIHWKRWDEESAVAFFCNATGCSEGFANMVVSRSAAVPGQLCAYKIGLCKMRGYLGRYRDAKQGEFKLQDFHHAVLGHGALPFHILDRVMAASL